MGIVWSRRHFRRLTAAGVVLAVLSLAGAVPAQAAPVSSRSSGAAAAPHPSRVHWSPCERGRFDCATVPVPLDYDKPNGASIVLSLIRLRATDPARRIGSLLVNPGGPGGSGVDLVLGFGEFLAP